MCVYVATSFQHESFLAMSHFSYVNEHPRKDMSFRILGGYQIARPLYRDHQMRIQPFSQQPSYEHFRKGGSSEECLGYSAGDTERQK